MKTELEVGFTELMKRMSEAELIEIITNLKDEFHPEAVKAAKSEISSRKQIRRILKEVTMNAKIS